MTQKLKIQNTTIAPQYVHAISGAVLLQPGEARDDLEFNDGEAKNLNANTKVFRVEGYQEGGTGDAAGSTGNQNGDGNAANAQLDAIAAALGTDRAGIMAEIERLQGEGGNGYQLTLPEAVRALDDNSDDDWTQAGLPNLDRLKTMTGGSVSRADVDAIGRKRATA